MCKDCSVVSRSQALAAFAALGTSLLASPAAALAGTDASPQALELGVPQMTRLANDVWLKEIAGGVFLHTTTSRVDGLWYPANGLAVRDGNGCVLVDTAWNTSQTAVILDALAKRGAHVTRAIVTHFHQDRLGGLPVLNERNIPAYANPLTVGLALAYGHLPPKPLAGLEKMPVRMGPLELYFPGEGHTRDNIVVYHAPSRLCFGGCFIKSVTASTLGNMADAVPGAWPSAAKNVAARYPNARHVIPGHGTIFGDTVAHTIALGRAYRE